MAMEVDEPGSDFGSDTGHPSSGKKVATGRGKGAAPSTVPRKKATGSGRRKNVVSYSFAVRFDVWLIEAEAGSDEDGDEDNEEMSDDELPKSTRRTNRTVAPRFAFYVPYIASVV